MGESGPCGLPLVQWQAVSCVGERWRACGKWVSHLGPGRALLLCPFSHLPTVLPQLPCWTTEKLLSPTHPLLSLSLSFSSSIHMFFFYPSPTPLSYTPSLLQFIFSLLLNVSLFTLSLLSLSIATNQRHNNLTFILAHFLLFEHLMSGLTNSTCPLHPSHSVKLKRKKEWA